jgi:outer membrane protein assembly factor BamB
MNEREWNIHRARATARNGLYALRPGAGRGDLTDSAVLWRYEKGLPNIPSPVLYKNVLYMLKEGGILTALDPASGSVLKQGRLEGALEPYFASPVAGDGKLFTVSLNGKLAVIEAGPEWKILSVSDLGEECWATPAIAGGRLYVRTASAIYCFGNKPQP